jgi:hypothetical protein
LSVLAALTELRWIIGETGVMGVSVCKGTAPEAEEQFAAGVQVDWSMPELASMSRGDVTFDAAAVQSWLDAAALSGESAIKADGAQLAPLVGACDNDVQRFALMAEVAFRDAAERGACTLDDAAIAAGMLSCQAEEGAG